MLGSILGSPHFGELPYPSVKEHALISGLGFGVEGLKSLEGS